MINLDLTPEECVITVKRGNRWSFPATFESDAILPGATIEIRLKPFAGADTHVDLDFWLDPDDPDHVLWIGQINTGASDGGVFDVDIAPPGCGLNTYISAQLMVKSNTNNPSP